MNIVKNIYNYIEKRGIYAMKNKICYLVNLFIIIQICFCTKSMAVETNSNQYTNEQIAIREIADAYYNKGIKHNIVQTEELIFMLQKKLQHKIHFIVCVVLLLFRHIIKLLG